MCYWNNSPYIYPSSIYSQLNNVTNFNTGWHVLPTMLWKHFISPRQWYELAINYEAYHVEGYTATLYNPIPITQNLAIQGTSTFSAFNNTIYTLGAQDILYETSYHNWWTDPIWSRFYVAYKEGVIRTGQEAAPNTRLVLPTYLWETPSTAPVDNTTWAWDAVPPAYPTAGTTWPDTGQGNKVSFGSGVFWDPLTDPDSIMELRPGKNSMTFNWSAHGCDESIWYNIDQLAKLLPYVPEGPWTDRTSTTGNTSEYGPGGTRIPNPIFQDPMPQSSFTSTATETAEKYKGQFAEYSMPNLLNLPVVPIQWFWIELEKNLIETKDTTKPQLNWPGTEYAAYKYPPTQCFVKGIPLYDENNTLISTTTQGCLRVTLHLKVKKRRSRYFAPTWGPMSWEMTSMIQSPFVLSTVRYRTAGARRGWQSKTDTTPTTTTNNRWDPYTSSTYTTATTTRTINTLAVSRMHT